MHIKALIDDRRNQPGMAPGEECAGQHIEIAGVDDVRCGEPCAVRSCPARTGKDLPDTLHEGAITRFAEVHMLTVEGARIAAAHHEPGDLKTVIEEAADPAPDGRVGGIVTEKGDPGHLMRPAWPVRK